ncbi:four-carbon acid sugar kinase family protein, partial [Nitratireductor sp. GCM10026969]|uniref:four-carbon acid sugar kinase family protein n=1 Tax=Nitratireductor sp. GCM10026969 TaxID=3252645 RepID=UPI003623180C
MADVLLIADDLTGALDSAVAFAERGMCVVAALGVDHLPRALAQNAHVVAVSTGSRELAPEAARAAMTAVGDAAAGFSGILFKKVDSRLKGPVAAELDVVSTMKPGPVLACPAIPRLGRYVVDGAVTGAGVDAPIDVRSAIGRAATVPDATADTDIDAALPDTLGQTLFVGAAGLAEAL